MDYEFLLNRALGRITSNVDKTEGSLIYDAIAPCMFELANAYDYIDELERQVFADTATGQYLERRTSERGITRREAEHAERVAIFNIPVPIGSRWGKEDLIYIVTTQQSDTNFMVKCETAGSVGNVYNGEMINLDAVPNVTVSNLSTVIIFGVDEETDDELRERYFNSFDSQAFGGNIQDYKDKTGTINGVGQVKVFPTFDGPGTVKVSILDVNNNIANAALINTVQEALDPTVNSGQGLGLAPIGHVVTVDTPTSITVNISFSLTFSGTTFPQVQVQVTSLLNQYLESLRVKWADETAVVRIAQIESDILSISGIIDITGTTINGNNTNLTLTDQQVPILGTVTNV